MPNLPKKVMLSAVAPSNRLTLGNYIGAVRNWVSLQHDYDCIFFAVDMHAITTRQDPNELREQTLRALAVYIAAGIDPEKTTLFVQSHVPEHAELAWALNCFCYMGELSRMTQFKDKSAKAGQNIPVGLFDYPVLMAADILLYDTDLVPVGEDQKQHIELTRDVAERMNHVYGEDLFRIPTAYVPKVGARVRSLQDPSQKMSKSNPDANASIFLSDTDDQIRKKMKRAVTDSGSEITADAAQLGVYNLLSIQSALTGREIPSLVEGYAGKQYGHLKLDTAEVVVEALRPVRTKAEELLADRTYLTATLKRGAEQARQRACVTLARVYDRLGFVPRG